ncbi:MAG: hypothetical protein JKX97_07810 [Candidatus Lindowbacteria bacterium]|nr:hypothetical protein [Candidatus Lindowbacteria bacterium]
MDKLRWSMLFGGAIISVLVGLMIGRWAAGSVLMGFDMAISTAGASSFLLLTNLAGTTGTFISWIIFGIVMTNSLIVSSSLSLVLLLTKRTDS